MKKNHEVKNIEKQERVSVNVDTAHAKPLQNEADLERVFIMPSVPRPGITSWSLVL